jgi:hypothetical protein
MTNNAITIFQQSLGASPLKLAALFAVVLMFFVGIAIIKVVKNGLTEVQDNERFDYSDYAMLIIRVLLVMLLIAIFFGL